MYSPIVAQAFCSLVAVTHPDSTIYVSHTNRKWDRIIHEVNGKPETLFFVARVDGRKKVRKLAVDIVAGDIFGPKSNHAPNIARFYGTIETASKWSWGSHPMPVSDETVQAVRTYGDVTHFVKIAKPIL